MTTIIASKVRQNFKSILDKVRVDRMPITILRRGNESIILVSEKEWNGMTETNYLLSNPKNAKRLLKSIEDSEKIENLISFDPTK